MASSYSRHGGDYGYQEPGWQGGEPGAYGAPEPDAPYPGAPLDPAAPVPVASRLVQYAGAATSVALILGVVIWGYRLADGPVWWGPTPALKGINNLLILLAFYLFAAAGMKTIGDVAARPPRSSPSRSAGACSSSPSSRGSC